MMPRFKVWTLDPDGEPGRILLRTGSSETLDEDVPFAGNTAAEVAAVARRRSGHVGGLYVKNFDTGEVTTIDTPT